MEANYELREPDPAADPNTPQGQRQIFLRHGTFVSYSLVYTTDQLAEAMRVLKYPTPPASEEPDEGSESH